MSEIFLGYLVNSILRGGILVLMLLIAEFALRRRMLFAGGRTLYLLAMVLVLLPLEQLSGFRSAASLCLAARASARNLRARMVTP